MATAVQDRSDEATALALEHPMLEALMAGTRAMRAAGEKLLPKEPLEEIEDYNLRKARATLFPAYRRTVSVMAGKPFSKQCILSEDTPTEIAGTPETDATPGTSGWADDIDREGVSLHVFAAEMFAESFYGLCGILVDAPKPPEPSAKVVTLADEKAAGIRPYFVRVMHSQLLGWRVETINGARQLTQLRISETATVPDGDFGNKKVERVRVLEPGNWRLFQKADEAGADGKEKYIQIDGGPSGLAYIPFVPIYGRRVGFMNGAAPLLDLAYLNVKHWQDESDQDDSVKFARKRILAIIGRSDTKAPIVASANYAVDVPLGGDIKVVQGSAESVTVGRTELDALEEQMIQAGAELLVKKPGDRSATESANDAEANKCDLQRMVEGFEDSLDSALQMLADYAKLSTGGCVELYKDFGATSLSAATAQFVSTWQAAGLITKVSAVRELQRRGELSPDIDPEQEVQDAADEAPPPLMLTGPADPTTKPGEDPTAEAA